MKRNLLTWIVLGILLAITGCAVGRKLSFENVPTGLDYTPAKAALIVFQDRRAEVLSGKWKPSLCGHNNSTIQISYEILTRSGRPLADEFAEAVSKAYTKLGPASKPFFVNMNTNFDSILHVFRTDTLDRLLYFDIYKWESRAMPLWSTIRYGVSYSFLLTVYNKNGDSLASGITQDVFEKEVSSGATSMKKMQEFADSVFKAQMRILFGNPAIKKSLL